MNQLDKAKQICIKNGQNLTPTRETVLLILMQSMMPLSAYDILDKYRANHAQGAQPPTIYRALSFLEENGFIHRMASTRQFVVCDHIGEHSCCGVTPFFICDECGTVAEGVMPTSVLTEVDEHANKIGFTVKQSKLEIHGKCKSCQ